MRLPCTTVAVPTAPGFSCLQFTTGMMPAARAAGIDRRTPTGLAPLPMHPSHATDPSCPECRAGGAIARQPLAKPSAAAAAKTGGTRPPRSRTCMKSTCYQHAMYRWLRAYVCRFIRVQLHACKSESMERNMNIYMYMCIYVHMQSPTTRKPSNDTDSCSSAASRVVTNSRYNSCRATPEGPTNTTTSPRCCRGRSLALQPASVALC